MSSFKLIKREVYCCIIFITWKCNPIMIVQCNFTKTDGYVKLCVSYFTTKFHHLHTHKFHAYTTPRTHILCNDNRERWDGIQFYFAKRRNKHLATRSDLVLIATMYRATAHLFHINRQSYQKPGSPFCTWHRGNLLVDKAIVKALYIRSLQRYEASYIMQAIWARPV